jgi:hypothetical protein
MPTPSLPAIREYSTQEEHCIGAVFLSLLLDPMQPYPQLDPPRLPSPPPPQLPARNPAQDRLCA